MKNRLIIGIDPGASGAMAVIDSNGQPVSVTDFHPVDSLKELAKYAKFTEQPFVVIEHVHAMPMNGSIANFKLAYNFGTWNGWIDCLGLDKLWVSPVRWQKHFGLVKTEKCPKPSLPFCRKHFPTVDLHLQKHNGRSDALCIATYGLDYIFSNSNETEN